MFYFRELKRLARRRKKVSIENFKLNMDVSPQKLTTAYGKKMFNYKSGGKVLEGALSVKPFSLGTFATGADCFLGNGGKLVYFRKFNREINKQEDYLVVYVDDEKALYYIDLGDAQFEVKKLQVSPFVETPNFINYTLDGEDVLLMSSKMDSLSVWDGLDKIQIIEGAPKISSMCMHYERLFATDSELPNYLRFSDDLDPRNWSVSLEEAGFIEIVDGKGKLRKVVSFLDYLYVFKTYGIFRITAFGDQSQFSVQELFTSMGKIYEDSITLCGDRIIFLASDGLYVFDGLAARKLELGITNLIKGADFSNICTSYYEGKYYIAFRYDFMDGGIYGVESGNYVNNTLVEFDINDNTITVVRGVDICSMLALTMDEYLRHVVLVREKGGLRLGTLEDGGNSYYGSQLSCYFESGFIDFNETGKIKILQNVFVGKKGAIELCIYSDGVKSVFQLSNDKNKLDNLSIAGKDFQISVASNCEGGAVYSLLLEADVVE